MTELALNVSRYSLGILVGAMLFFPSVVAPIVFRTVGEEGASKFLRALFPRYYLFMIIFSIIAAVALRLAEVWIGAAIIVFIVISTLWVRHSLVPHINAHRDAEFAGDEEAGVAFERGHKISVIINMAQLLAAIGVMVAIA